MRACARAHTHLFCICITIFTENLESTIDLLILIQHHRVTLHASNMSLPLLGHHLYIHTFHIWVSNPKGFQIELFRERRPNDIFNTLFTILLFRDNRNYRNVLSISKALMEIEKKNKWKVIQQMTS